MHASSILCVKVTIDLYYLKKIIKKLAICLFASKIPQKLIFRLLNERPNNTHRKFEILSHIWVYKIEVKWVSIKEYAVAIHTNDFLSNNKIKKNAPATVNHSNKTPILESTTMTIMVSFFFLLKIHCIQVDWLQCAGNFELIHFFCVTKSSIGIVPWHEYESFPESATMWLRYYQRKAQKIENLTQALAKGHPDDSSICTEHTNYTPATCSRWIKMATRNSIHATSMSGSPQL